MRLYQTSKQTNFVILLVALVISCSLASQAAQPISIAPIDAARETLSQLLMNPPPTEFADLLSNRTAASLGEGDMIRVDISIYLLSQSTDPKVIKMANEITEQLNVLYKKYGLSADSIHDGVAVANEHRGREFYVDVMSLAQSGSEVAEGLLPQNKLHPEISGTSGQMALLGSYSKDIRNYRFFDVSATEVKITQALSQFIAFRAIFEDGKWRIDLVNSNGDLQLSLPDLTKSPVPVVDASEFVHEVPNKELKPSWTSVSFHDLFAWTIDDKVAGIRTTSTTDGREVDVYLGRKADYYHILNTDLVLRKIHDTSYPRIDTMSDAITHDDVDRVRFLIDHNPSFLEEAPGSTYPLNDSVFFDAKDIVMLLIRMGANVNARGDDGDTPLIEAAQFGKPDMVRILLKAGASTTLKDNQGKTALSLAINDKDSEIIRLLQRAEANK